MFIFTDPDFRPETLLLSKIYQEKFKKFDQNCFREMEATDTRVTFLGHGVRDNTSQKIVFGNLEQSPQEFVEALIAYNLPKTVKTIDIVACYVGLSQGDPTYLDLVVEELKTRSDYAHINVRGFTYSDPGKKFSQMSLSVNKEIKVLTCILFTEAQKNERKKYDEDVKELYSKDRELSSNLSNSQSKFDSLTKQISTLNTFIKNLKEVEEKGESYKLSEEEMMALNYEGQEIIEKQAIKDFIGMANNELSFMGNDILEEEEKIKDYKIELDTVRVGMSSLYKTYEQNSANSGIGMPKGFLETELKNMRYTLDQNTNVISKTHTQQQQVSSGDTPPSTTEESKEGMLSAQTIDPNIKPKKNEEDGSKLGWISVAVVDEQVVDKSKDTKKRSADALSDDGDKNKKFSGNSFG